MAHLLHASKRPKTKYVQEDNPNYKYCQSASCESRGKKFHIKDLQRIEVFYFCKPCAERIQV